MGGAATLPKGILTYTGQRSAAAVGNAQLARDLSLLLTPCSACTPRRRNLPVKYRPVISAVIGGDMDYDALHRWFNATFLIAACASTVRWQGQGQEGSGRGVAWERGRVGDCILTLTRAARASSVPASLSTNLARPACPLNARCCSTA